MISIEGLLLEDISGLIAFALDKVPIFNDQKENSMYIKGIVPFL